MQCALNSSGDAAQCHAEVSRESSTAALPARTQLCMQLALSDPHADPKLCSAEQFHIAQTLHTLLAPPTVISKGRGPSLTPRLCSNAQRPISYAVPHTERHRRRQLAPARAAWPPVKACAKVVFSPAEVNPAASPAFLCASLPRGTLCLIFIPGLGHQSCTKVSPAASPAAPCASLARARAACLGPQATGPPGCARPCRGCSAAAASLTGLRDPV